MSVDMSKLPAVGKQRAARPKPAPKEQAAPKATASILSAIWTLKGQTSKGLLVYDLQDRSGGIFGTFYIEPSRVPETWKVSGAGHKLAVVAGEAQ